MLSLLVGKFKQYSNLYLWGPFKRIILPRLGYYLPAAQKQTQKRAQPDQITLMSIGKIKSVFKEKFGTPRQGSMVPDGRGCLVIDKRAVDPRQSLESLDQFTHVWLIFLFHHSAESSSSAKVRPPNFGGNKVGVFATRSPHRPSPVGLSLAKISRVDMKTGTVHLTGLDLCDGTPVIDIKPYNEGADWPGAGMSSTPAWLSNPKFDLAHVEFTEQALADLDLLVRVQGVMTWYTKQEVEVVRRAIEQIIALDPRDLNRGRGAFKAKSEEEAIPVKETSFSRREAKLRDFAVERPIYIRFDELNVTFQPASVAEERSFLVTKIERFRKALKDHKRVDAVLL